jgi:hypothetical protein
MIYTHWLAGSASRADTFDSEAGERRLPCTGLVALLMSDEFAIELSTLCLYDTDTRLCKDYLIPLISSRSWLKPPLISFLISTVIE